MTVEKAGPNTVVPVRNENLGKTKKTGPKTVTAVRNPKLAKSDKVDTQPRVTTNFARPNFRGETLNQINDGLQHNPIYDPDNFNRSDEHQSARKQSELKRGALASIAKPFLSALKRVAKLFEFAGNAHMIDLTRLRDGKLTAPEAHRVMDKISSGAWGYRINQEQFNSIRFSPSFDHYLRDFTHDLETYRNNPKHYQALLDPQWKALEAVAKWDHSLMEDLNEFKSRYKKPQVDCYKFATGAGFNDPHSIQ